MTAPRTLEYKTYHYQNGTDGYWEETFVGDLYAVAREIACGHPLAVEAAKRLLSGECEKHLRKTAE